MDSLPPPPASPPPARSPSPAVWPLPSASAVALVLGLALLLVGAPASAEGPRWRWPAAGPPPVAAPFEAPEHRYAPGHRGLDLGPAGAGTEVRAVEAGTVRFAGSVAGRGTVSVLHADGLLSTYQPVTALVTAGQEVSAGDLLATLADDPGASHCGPGLCLHLGARRGEDYLDPALLLGMRGPSVLLPWQGDQGAGQPRTTGRAPMLSARIRRAGGPARRCGGDARR